MFTTRPEIAGTFGVVASTHWIASGVGMGILERGGNAFDAAVGMAFTLQVVEPHLNGPGGEAPILIYPEREKRVRVLCGQGVMPQAATIERVRGLGLDLIPGSGLLPACVPGSFDAWMTLLRDHGTMSVSEVLTPAILYARDGYPLVQRISDTIASLAEMFAKEWPTSAAVYLPGGKAPEGGKLFRNPGLAETYARIAREAEIGGRTREQRIDHARHVWSQGFVAEAVGKFAAANEVMDASGRRHRGLITADDMARWQATYDEPAKLDYHRYTMCKCGPWSQGPTMLQILALLAGYDVAAMDPLGTEFVHAVAECFKLAFADREAFYADPNFVKVPMERLLSKDYADQRRKLISREASREIRPGSIPGFGGPILIGSAVLEGIPGLASQAVGEPTIARLNTGHGAGEPALSRNGVMAGDTVHLDVIDRHGNMVSATPSGGWLQS